MAGRDSSSSEALQMSRTYAHADPDELLALANEKMHRCEHHKAERRGSNPFVDPKALVNARIRMKTRDRKSSEHCKAERRGSNPFVDPKSLMNARIRMKTKERRHRHSDDMESSSHRRSRDGEQTSDRRRRKSRDSLDGGSSHHKPRGGTRSSAKSARGLEDYFDGPSGRTSKKGSSHSVTSRTSRIRDDTKLRSSDRGSTHSRRSHHERKPSRRHFDGEDSPDEKAKHRSMSPNRSSGSRQSSVRSSMNDTQGGSLSPKRKSSTRQSSLRSSMNDLDSQDGSLSPKRKSSTRQSSLRSSMTDSQDLSLSPKRKSSTRQSSVRSCASTERSLSPKRTSSVRHSSSRRNPVEVDAEEIARKQIEKQQKLAMESMKARVPKRLSLENDDMFTMFRWSTDSLHDELKVDYEREEFAKARKQESKKRLEPLTVQSVFSEEDLELIPTQKEKPKPSLLRRLSNSVNHKPGLSPDKTNRRGSFFGRLMRRASTTFGGFGGSYSDRDTMVTDSDQS